MKTEIENIILEYGNRLLAVQAGKENPTLGELIDVPTGKLLALFKSAVGEHKPANDGDAKYNFPEHYNKVQTRYEMAQEILKSLGAI